VELIMIGEPMFDFIADVVGKLILEVVMGAIREYHLLTKKNPDKVTSSVDENGKEVME
jgi:hypothetical protein